MWNLVLNTEFAIWPGSFILDYCGRTGYLFASDWFINNKIGWVTLGLLSSRLNLPRLLLLS